MRMRILYSLENLVEIFRVEPKTIKLWTRLGIVPSLDGYSPRCYDKKEIDGWIDSGQLEKHRPREYHHMKGVY